MSFRYNNPNRPFAPGDKVLVSATITEIDLDGDPHDPSVIVWFNGQPHATTVMNLRHDTTGKPITRSSWGVAPEVPSTILPLPNQFETQTWNPADGDTFTFNSADFDDPANLIVDVSPNFLDSVDALLDLVETPADEEPEETGGRTAPRNQEMIFDARRKGGGLR